MQLDYTILWVDDNPENLRSMIEELKDYLEDKGFILNKFLAKNKDELEIVLETTENIDFIVMDNKFGQDNLGASLISSIRARNIFSDIIFCSSMQSTDLLKELKESLEQTSIQGVFVYTKGELTDDISLITNIIDYRIKKEMNLLSIRGLAMATIAEFDKCIFNLLCQAGKKELIIKSAQNGICSRADSNLKLVTEQKKEKLWKNLTSHSGTIYWDSSHRGKEFFTIIVDELSGECHHKTKCDTHATDYANLLTRRNKLAHQLSKFDEKDMLEFRKDLIKFKKTFCEIEEDLCQQKQ